ncbi:MAG TPA: GNAT family N-acetyltransferase [Terriglobales bacterium]|nr:GNAT family N-acetyltransferase [Terriglobales bacterium]
MSVHPEIRPAGLADAAAIAALHAAVWHHTYRHLATPAAITALTAAHRLKHWQAVLATDDPQAVTVVAEIDRTIVGFVRAAPSQEPLFGGRCEVKYLYVDGTQARRGIGRLLLARIAQLLRQRGHRGLALGVVDGNGAAIKFYEALGGKLIGRYTDPGPLWRSDNRLYAWDDLAVLTGGKSAG